MRGSPVWSTHYGAFSDTQQTNIVVFFLSFFCLPNLGGGAFTTRTHTHTPPWVFNPVSSIPEQLGSSGNTLRADYSSKLVWGHPTHPSWGDAVVWKSNRPLSQTQRRPKLNWAFGLPCCWQLFRFLWCHSFHTILTEKIQLKIFSGLFQIEKSHCGNNSIKKNIDMNCNCIF